MRAARVVMYAVEPHLRGQDLCWGRGTRLAGQVLDLSLSSRHGGCRFNRSLPSPARSGRRSTKNWAYLWHRRPLPSLPRASGVRLVFFSPGQCWPACHVDSHDSSHHCGDSAGASIVPTACERRTVAGPPTATLLLRPEATASRGTLRLRQSMRCPWSRRTGTETGTDPPP